MTIVTHRGGATAAITRTTLMSREIGVDTTLNTLKVGPNFLALANNSNLSMDFGSRTGEIVLPGGTSTGGGRLRFRNNRFEGSNSSGVFGPIAGAVNANAITSITLERFATLSAFPTGTVARWGFDNSSGRAAMSNASGTFRYALFEGDTFNAPTATRATTAGRSDTSARADNATRAALADLASGGAGNAAFRLPSGNNSQRAPSTTPGDVRYSTQFNKFEGRNNSGYDFFVMESALATLVRQLPTGGTANQIPTIAADGRTIIWIDRFQTGTNTPSFNPASYTGNYGAIVSTGNIRSLSGNITTNSGSIGTSNGNFIVGRLGSSSSAAGNVTAQGTVTAERFTVNGEYSLPTAEAARVGQVIMAINPVTSAWRDIPNPTQAAGTAGFIIPVGDNAMRGTATRGKFRLNSSSNKPEIGNGTGWDTFVMVGDKVNNAGHADTAGSATSATTADRASAATLADRAVAANGIGGFAIGVGTTATRSTASTRGLFRMNSETDRFEGRRATGWHSLAWQGENDSQQYQPGVSPWTKDTSGNLYSPDGKDVIVDGGLQAESISSFNITNATVSRSNIITVLSPPPQGVFTWSRPSTGRNNNETHGSVSGYDSTNSSTRAAQATWSNVNALDIGLAASANLTTEIASITAGSVNWFIRIVSGNGVLIAPVIGASTTTENGSTVLRVNLGNRDEWVGAVEPAGIISNVTIANSDDFAPTTEVTTSTKTIDYTLPTEAPTADDQIIRGNMDGSTRWANEDDNTGAAETFTSSGTTSQSVVVGTTPRQVIITPLDIGSVKTFELSTDITTTNGLSVQIQTSNNNSSWTNRAITDTLRYRYVRVVFTLSTNSAAPTFTAFQGTPSFTVRTLVSAVQEETLNNVNLASLPGSVAGRRLPLTNRYSSLTNFSFNVPIMDSLRVVAVQTDGLVTVQGIDLDSWGLLPKDVIASFITIAGNTLVTSTMRVLSNGNISYT